MKTLIKSQYGAKADGIFWVGKDRRWPQRHWWVATPFSEHTIER
jgi:hypothetical protein